MKKLTKISIVILIFLLGFSCTKDLTLEPISSITTASFWKTENDAQGVLIGMYVRLKNVTDQELIVFGEGRSQDIQEIYAKGQNRILANTLDATDAGPDWRNIYRVVYDASLLLKHVPAIKFASEAKKNNILAQAHTMRAFLYFIAVRTWGEVPLVTEPTEAYDYKIINKERSPVAEVFRLIKKDIDDAVALFPDNTYPAGRNMWSKPAVNALKADVYLWTGKRLAGGNADFNTALTALNDIETTDVSLLANFASIFDYTNKGNKEIIMAVNYKENEEGNNTSFLASMYYNTTLDISPEAIASIGQKGGGNSFEVSDETRAKFTTDDNRKAASFLELFLKDASGAYTVFHSAVQKKFDGVVISGVRKFLDDVVIYRYADILLLKAEAKNALGQDPSADINKVRQRAYGANYAQHFFVNGTQEANDAKILDERCIELLFEGKRWWDILRFGKAFELVPGLRNHPGDNYRLLFPLSLDILSQEPLVKQNPGY